MCKVYEFPTKFELPDEIKTKIEHSARLYVKTLTEVLDYVDEMFEYSDNYEHVVNAVMQEYMVMISKASEELDL